MESREKVAAIFVASPKVRDSNYAAEYRLRLNWRNAFARWKSTMAGREIESLEDIGCASVVMTKL